MGIVQRIKLVCKNKKTSIAATARAAGISENAIYTWDKNIPSIEKIAKVARFLDVSIDYLLGITENPISHKNNLNPSTVQIMYKAEELDLSGLETDITISFMEMIKQKLKEKKI